MSIRASYLFQDWNGNHHNPKGRVFMIIFRCASYISRYLILQILFCWYLLLYRFIAGWILNIEIDPKATIGRDFRLEYGFGSVINATAHIGSNCTLRHLTTISCKILEDGSHGPSPNIGNNVDIGVNATIIGDIRIGDDVVIGAGSVVVKDVESHCVVGGNPTTILKMIYKFPLQEEDQPVVIQEVV